MAKCEYCGKGVTFGIQVSHSHRRSNRICLHPVHALRQGYQSGLMRAKKAPGLFVRELFYPGRINRRPPALRALKIHPQEFLSVREPPLRPLNHTVAYRQHSFLQDLTV